MKPHEVQVPFPLDMLGDLDTTLRHVEDNHLATLDTPEKQQPFHALVAAARAIRAAIHAHRAKSADAQDLPYIPLERQHVSDVVAFARGAQDVGADAHRAATNVADWLDRGL
ncbi:hypothetical protein KPL78_02520 [Roseomonas sp. HJA6]|uniref:Uncharacterized protein n=1 Tax=Roseomonas alba TaxID=2846776 RepID=A0ABS7A314_9PROT|nr:hypothetical protein [Neoroseomonas alba]MBW6396699.1 hypothetical protein [Neoroseomonas alba]